MSRATSHPCCGPPLRKEGNQRQYSPLCPGGSSIIIFDPRKAPARTGLFSSAAWLEALRRGFGFSFTASGYPNGGAVLAARIEDYLGKRLVGLPFSDYQRPELAGEELVRALEALACTWPGHSVRLRLDLDAQSPEGEAGGEQDLAKLLDEVHATSRFQSECKAVFHTVHVTNEDQLWGGLSSAFRRAVRKARSGGIEIRLNRDRKGMARFYRLAVRHRMARFGVLTYPWAFFDALWELFVKPGNGFVLEAWNGEELAASLVALGHTTALFYKFGVSRPEMLDARPNNLLFWELLCQGVKEGRETIDLGMSWVSGEDEGLRRFKESLGGRPRPIHFLRRDPPGYDPTGELEARNLLRTLTGVLCRPGADPETAAMAGDTLYRYFT